MIRLLLSVFASVCLFCLFAIFFYWLLFAIYFDTEYFILTLFVVRIVFIYCSHTNHCVVHSYISRCVFGYYNCIVYLFLSLIFQSIYTHTYSVRLLCGITHVNALQWLHPTTTTTAAKMTTATTTLTHNNYRKSISVSLIWHTRSFVSICIKIYWHFVYICPHNSYLFLCSIRTCTWWSGYCTVLCFCFPLFYVFPSESVEFWLQNVS